MKIAYLIAFFFTPQFTVFASEVPGPKSIYRLEQQWTSQSGKKISLADLKGRPAIVTMIFTTCPATCPRIVSDIKKLDSLLTKQERKQLRYILFSIDPARDVPEALSRFADKMKLDKRWMLLTSDADQVRELSAVLGYNYKPLDGGDFTHSTNLYLFSANGELVRTKDSGTSQSEFLNSLKNEINRKNK